MRNATTEELKTLKAAPSPEALAAAVEKVLTDTGQRMPTIYETVDGYTKMLRALGVPDKERLMLTALAGHFTRGKMAENDAKGKAA